MQYSVVEPLPGGMKMKFQQEALSPSIGSGSSTFDVQPSGIHATLIDVAADGQSLAAAAKDTRVGGDRVAGLFGSADVVAAAFSTFWSGRDDVGERVASLVFRKADAVSTASQAFTEADATMDSEAAAALSQLSAAYRPPSPVSGRQAVQQPW